MRGIEPNNKCNVVFPSFVLPSRCYGNPPSPEGEGLTGHGHDVISSEGVAEVEKSPRKNRDTVVHVTRRDGGVPPYRRLRRKSDPLSFRALDEKSPAVEKTRYIHDSPKHSPAGVPCRQSPRQPFPLPRDSHATATPTLRMTIYKGVRGG